MLLKLPDVTSQSSSGTWPTSLRVVVVVTGEASHQVGCWGRRVNYLTLRINWECGLLASESDKEEILPVPHLPPLSYRWVNQLSALTQTRAQSYFRAFLCSIQENISICLSMSSSPSSLSLPAAGSWGPVQTLNTEACVCFCDTSVWCLLSIHLH